MLFVDSDFNEGDSTFSSNLKSGGNGQIMVKVYACSGMVTKCMYPVGIQYTTSGNGWFQPLGASTGAASQAGLVGIASDGIASGCVGWATVRGKVADAVAYASVDFTGSIGNAVTWWGASGMSASSSAYIGAIHQIGFLTEDLSTVGYTNVVNIFLTGNMHAQSI